LFAHWRWSWPGVVGFQPSPNAGFFRIKPGNAGHSAIPFRAAARDNVLQAGTQMPPIAAHIPDAAGVVTASEWINAMR
jgi:hypothetical protein